MSTTELFLSILLSIAMVCNTVCLAFLWKGFRHLAMISTLSKGFETAASGIHPGIVPQTFREWGQAVHNASKESLPQVTPETINARLPLGGMPFKVNKGAVISQGITSEVKADVVKTEKVTIPPLKNNK